MSKNQSSLRWQLLSILLIVSLCMPFAGFAEDADLYFENGVVYTVDAQDSIAQALAVKDGVIVFVGSAADGEAYREGAAEVIDLAGNMLMPGMIDGHLHAAAPEFFDFDLAGIGSLDEAMRAIEDYVTANPGKESYRGAGFLTSLFAGEELVKGPRKERLDAICPDKPIIITAFDGHSVWLNSACFALAGITEDTQVPPGGSIPKDDETGALWGTLLDSAMALMPAMTLPMDQLLPALENLHAYLNSLGFTSIMSLPGNGFFPVPWEGYVALEEQGLLTLRIRSAGIITGWRTQEDLDALAVLKETYQSDLVRLTTAKIFADGVMDNESAFLLEPYADNPDNYGVSDWSPDALHEAVAAINALGVQAHVHAIGDGAVHMALDAFAHARDHAPQGDYRNAITHLQLVAEEDFQRFADLDAVAVAQPYWHYKEPGYWAQVEHKALGERSEHEYPLKTFFDHGVVTAFASDFPVTPHPNPFVCIEIAVTRNIADPAAYGIEEDIRDMDDPAYLLWPEQRVTVQQAIRASTINGAYSIFAEDVTGSLEVGKSADMIVIDQNILEINPIEISNTRVLRTYLEGTLVYSAEP